MYTEHDQINKRTVKDQYTPTNSSWPNRIEAQFTALRYFMLDGTDHTSHKEQGSMIRRYTTGPHFALRVPVPPTPTARTSTPPPTPGPGTTKWPPSPTNNPKEGNQ
nr:hypothetical protein [Streptomyces noursei]